MTGRALRDGKASGNVIGDVPAKGLRAVPLGKVAGSVAAIGGLDREVVIVVGVAAGAGCGDMSASQDESRHRVIEGADVRPGNRVVALRAICDGEGDAGSGMYGIVGLLPGREVAAGVAAIGGSNLEIVIVVGMATGAGNVGVACGERKPRGAVVELGSEPTIERMTALAIRGGEGRPGACVRGIGSILPILEMAGIALRGEAVEDSGS